jgi:hypothetical protein
MDFASGWHVASDMGDMLDALRASGKSTLTEIPLTPPAYELFPAANEIDRQGASALHTHDEGNPL